MTRHQGESPLIYIKLRLVHEGHVYFILLDPSREQPETLTFMEREMALFSANFKPTKVTLRS